MESTTLEVRPAEPVAPYIGGKSRLAQFLVGLIDAVDHHTYAEPFTGMGGVFLRRGRRARAEVINDISGDVVTLFRILQRHYPQFIDTLKWQLSSRAEFERLTSIDPTTLTDLERAARFLYLQRLAWGGKVSGRNFGVDPRSPGGFDLTKLVPMLEDVHERLAGVTIERLPFAQFITRYDLKSTLFYLDPPYWGGEKDYGPGVFNPADFAALAGQLRAIVGKFILSINDTPATRAIFAGFRIIDVRTTYTIGSSTTTGGGRAGELVVTNVPEGAATLV